VPHCTKQEELAPNNDVNAIRELLVNLENGWKDVNEELVKYFEKANN
jgi:hypothetical protein